MLLPSAILSLVAVATKASATNLFVSDYAGAVTSLQFTQDSNGQYSLAETHVSYACAPNPSWLTIDASHGVLYCLNEGLVTPNGSLSSYIINGDGSLRHVQNTTTPNGPVSGVIYGPAAGQRAIALAHYGGSAVTSWLLGQDATFTANQELFYTLSSPGPEPDRQDAPHEHEAITDPTGQYILVPDLGADLVRVFSWDTSTLKLITHDPLHAVPGSGPRHAAFHTPSGLTGGSTATYLYLVSELAGTVTAYRVTYLAQNSGLHFTELSVQPTTGPYKLHRRCAPAEIHVSPDNRFLLISNRNDSSFTIPPHNHPSDSLATFALPSSDDTSGGGNITFHQLWPAGGVFARQFSMNSIGNLVAVGLQYDQAVVVMARDVATGLLGEPVARIQLGGNVTSIVWDEEGSLLDG